MNSRATLQHLFAQRTIRVASLPVDMDLNPERPSMDRVRGILMGLAIGDALGNTTESLNPTDRRRSHGEIRDYLPNSCAGGERVGMPSDDTQLAAWLLESLLAHRGLDVADVAKRFATRRIFGMGFTMRGFLRGYHSGKDLWACGQRSAGNGALMRVAAVPVFHLPRSPAAVFDDALLSSALTHNDPTSNASCVAFSAMLCELVHMTVPPPSDWWITRFVGLARPIEGGVRLRSQVPGCTFSGSLCEFLETVVLPALRGEVPLPEALDAWYSGAFLLETVPAALYILARHAEDPETALVRAVNETQDNDTVAAIVGAAVGALHGEQALPARWRQGLTGCTQADDDGRLFELIGQAVKPG